MSKHQPAALNSEVARSNGNDSADPLAASRDALNELTRVNSELVNLQRELGKRNAELLAIARQRDELLAMTAHDLRTPIAVVQSYCELLLRRGTSQLNEHDARLVRHMTDATSFMLQLLDQTLDYARIEAGRLSLKLERHDLNAIVERCVEAQRPIAAPKGISLVAEELEAIPHIELDALRIQQVLNNLLSNAIKYSAAGSRVDVRVARMGPYATVTVSDQGQGIASQELSRLFRPFSTTSSRGTAGEASTGLGLAITKKLVELHGGRISVASIPQHGTTFTVQLPLRQMATSSSDSASLCSSLPSA